MSVLLCGMEIPERCGKCRFATAFECLVTKNFITTFNVRQADCPLIPVPPHGRLIDADAAIANRNTEMNWCYDLCDLPDYLADCPTVIPAELPKGEMDG